MSALGYYALSASENDFLYAGTGAVVTAVCATDSTYVEATIAADEAASCTYLFSAAKYPLNI